MSLKMVCICEDDGIDADCEVHGTMTNQEQAPLDLAAIERRTRAEARLDDVVPYDWRQTILALVTALKAAPKWKEMFRQVTEEVVPGLEEAAREMREESDQLRDDLVRVEAEAKKWREEAEQIHREDTELERLYEAAQARIAELEGSLRGVYETHGRVDDGPCWCGDCERARANLPAQTPSAS